MQGEPSLGAGLDVAQEHEEGGERTDWQVRLMRTSWKTKNMEEFVLQKVASFNVCVCFIADNALSHVDEF